MPSANQATRYHPLFSLVLPSGYSRATLGYEMSSLTCSSDGESTGSTEEASDVTGSSDEDAWDPNAEYDQRGEGRLQGNGCYFFEWFPNLTLTTVTVYSIHSNDCYVFM